MNCQLSTIHISAPPSDPLALLAVPECNTPPAPPTSAESPLQQSSPDHSRARRTTCSPCTASLQSPRQFPPPRQQEPAKFPVPRRAAIHPAVALPTPCESQSPASAAPLHTKAIHTIRCTPGPAPAIQKIPTLVQPAVPGTAVGQSAPIPCSH